MYVGKSDQNDAMTPNVTLCERVVLDLCTVIENSNRLVAIDNFFIIMNLMKSLFEDGTYACGTVRKTNKWKNCGWWN